MSPVDLRAAQPADADDVNCPVCGLEICEEHVAEDADDWPFGLEQDEPPPASTESAAGAIAAPVETASRRAIARSNVHLVTTESNGDAAGTPRPIVDEFPLTEAGDAEHFAAAERDRLLYDHAARRWFVFGAHHWRVDERGQVLQRAKDAMRRRQAAALTIADSTDRKRAIDWAVKGEFESRLRHMLDIAATERTLAIAGDEWDTEPMVLGVENGVIDLRTGLLRCGRPADRLTRVAAVEYDATATCDRWLRFVREIANDDADLAAYLGRIAGYAISGVTTEQVFFVLYGAGSNGKTTYLETITRAVLPEHSWTMPFPTTAWTESLSLYQRAELVGRRVVVASETDEARQLNTAFVKSLTGTEKINARQPYGRPFAFVPCANIFLACNHRPIIRDESHGMWRRVRLIPFARTFTVDPSLGDELATEASGILRWLVEQCLVWQRDGLGVPDAVKQATADFQQTSDRLSVFFADRCIVSAHARVQARDLWKDYVAWATQQQIPDADRFNQTTFGEAMKRKFVAIPGRHVFYSGIGLTNREVIE